MSGKNCFREKWSVEPTYSGGPISSCILESKPVGSLIEDASAAVEKREVLLGACGSVFNILDPDTGAKMASFTPPNDDVILNVTGMYVSASEGEDGRPAGSYAAFSTRALAVYVLRIEQNVDVEEFSANVDDEDENVISAKRFIFGSTYKLSLVRTWMASQHAVSHLAFSSCGRFLVTCSTAGNVKAWNVFQHHLTHNMDAIGHGVLSTAVFSLEIDPATKAPKYLAVGNAEGLVTVFDFAGEKRPIAAGQLHVSGIEGMIFVPDVKGSKGVRKLVTVGKDRKIVIASCDLSPPQLTSYKKKAAPIADITQERAIAIPEHVSCAVFDGHEYLHIGTEDGTVACYGIDLEGKVSRLRRTEQRSTEDQGAVEELDELYVRSLVVSKLRTSAEGDDAELKEDSGEIRLFVADAAFTICLLEAVASSKVLAKKHTLVAYLDQILDIKLVPNSKSLHERSRLVVTNSKDVRIFEQQGCVSTKVLQGHTDIVMCCAVSQCGTYAATGSKDQTVRLWDLATQTCIAASSSAKIDPTGHSGAIQSLSFSQRPSSTFHMLYSVGQDEALKSWDVAQVVGGAPMTARHSIASAHDGPIHVVAVAPNDAFVATGGKDKVVNVWNVNGKKVFKEANMKGHKRGVSALCFSPSDRIVASASNDGTIRLWSLASFSCLRTLQQEDKHPVLQCHFFNNGLQIVSSDAIGKVQVWGVATSDVIATLPLHVEKCWALAIAEDDKDTLFFSGAADGTMKVSEDFTAEEAARVRDEFTETILKEQELANALRREEFAEAFMLALRLNHPRHLRQVIVKWCAKGEEAAHDALVNTILPGLDDEYLSRLLEFTREWVTNARFCLTATFVLNALFDAFHFTKLQTLRGMKTTLEALTAYSAKHSVRMNKVLQRLYFVDYLCRHIHPRELTTSATLAIGTKRPRGDETTSH